VVLVLLDNAIKHTPQGGEVRIAVNTEASDGMLQIVDTGPGIPREHLPRVFDRFYRADSVRNRNDGGTGLGLAIAKSLIDAHGGQLSLANALGAGTAATLRLPKLDESADLPS
jgi:signal transduction histidine kinase